MMRFLPASGHRRVPWRNGGGVTDEIMVQPHPGQPEDPTRFAWRVSVAHVETAGPFSAFPGVDRMLMLVDGAGMELRIDDEPWTRIDRPFEPIAFSGDAAVDCRLIDGPVRDFNVMVDRATTRATLDVVEAGEEGCERLLNQAGDEPGRVRLLVALRGEAEVRGQQQRWTLGSMDALRLDDLRPVVLSLSPGARVAIVGFASSGADVNFRALALPS